MWTSFHNLLLIFLICLLPCLVAGPVRAEPSQEPLVVFSAASLTPAVQEILADYESRTGQKVLASFAGSNTLKQQILQGMPAHLYISADMRYIEELVAAGLVNKKDVVVLLRNNLVLIAGHDAEETGLEDLGKLPEWLNGEFLALADPQTVPAGRYAQESLARAGVWDQIKDQVVPALDVRAALALVDTGQVRYGMVYQTDVALARASRIVYRVPAGSHRPIRYGLCLVGQASESARDLCHAFQQESARQVFQRFGFIIP